MIYIDFDLVKLRTECRGKGYLLKKELEISHATLSRWLNGQSRLNIADLERICEVIGKKPIDFFAKNETWG